MFLSAIASVIGTARNVLVSSFLNVGLSAYFLIECAVCIITYTPILSYKKKLAKVKEIGKDSLVKISFFVEFPFFIREFSLLKAYEYQNISLTTSIMSMSPVYNFIYDKITSYDVMLYRTRINDNLLNENSINVVAKQKSYLLSMDNVALMLYCGAIICNYYAAQYESENKNLAFISPALYSTAAGLAASIARHYTKQYADDHDCEVFTYITFFTSLPWKILAFILCVSLFHEENILDSIDKDHYIPIKAILLSEVALAFNIILTLAIQTSTNLTNFSVIFFSTSNILANFFDLFIFKTIEFNMFFSGMVTLNLAACMSLLLKDHLDNKSDLLSIVTNGLEISSKEELKNNLLTEWKNNKLFYTNVGYNSEKLKIDLNPITLSILSNILNIRFNILDYNGNYKFIVKKTHTEQIIDIKINIKDKDFFTSQKFNGQLLMIDDTTISNTSLEQELIGNLNLIE
jgi:hypothetical protein